ncbi:MAG TPA: Ig-like domain repeat protein [bacterium]|nr:Ig-like domain repeat protein [bacterium]
MNRIVWSFILLIALAACSSNEAGGIRLHYAWTDEEGNAVTPPKMAQLYAWAELTYAGETKTAGPVWMGDDGNLMRFENLPYGPKMKLTITMRLIDGAGGDEDLLEAPPAPKAGTDNIAYRCTSQEFSLVRGTVTDVQNGCIMEPSAGIDPVTGDPTIPELKVFDLDGTPLDPKAEGGREASRHETVNLCYKAPNATQVHIANKANFSGEAINIEIPEATGGVCPEGYHAYEGWKFEEKLPEEKSDRIPWAVYLKASDDLGAETKSTSVQFFIDNKAPVIVNQVLSPTAANGSSTVVLALSFQEPVKELTLDSGDLVFKRIDDGNDPQFFQYRYLVSDHSDAEGTYSFSVTVIDQAGNGATIPLDGGLTIDRTLPDLTATIEKNDTAVESTTLYLKDGDELTVSLTLTEPPKDKPRVNLGTYPLDCTQGTDTEHYDCTLTLDKDTHAEGIADLTASFEDQAGNPYAAPLKAGIRLDYTAPTFTFTKNKATDYNATEQITLTITANETLSAVTIDGVAKNTDTITWNITGINTTETHEVKAGGTDLAGNIATEMVIGTYTVDADYPTATISDPTPERIAGGATATITLSNISETLVVTLNGDTALCEKSGDNYECTYTAAINGGDEVKTLVIAYTDNVGNTSSITKTVEIDRTPPSLTIDLNDDAFNANETIRITVTASEELDGLPVTEIPTAAMTLSSPTQISSFSWLYTLDPTLLDDDDDYTVRAAASDTVAWEDVALSAPFSVDTSTPDLVPGQYGVDRTKAGIGITYTVDFETTEPVVGIDGVPIVKANGIVLTDCHQNGGDTIFQCTRTVGDEEIDSTVYSITAALTDAAGNSRTVTIGSIMADKTYPDAMTGTAILSIDAGPDCALPQDQVTTIANGSTAYLSVQVSEKLESDYTPVLTAKKEDIVREFTLDSQNGLTYYFSYLYEEAIPTAAMIGEYTLELTLKDEAGNETTVTVDPDKPFQTAWNDPTLVVNQDLVTYTRSPWGRSAKYYIKDDDDNIVHTIYENDYYEIGTNDLYAKTDRLPAGAFSLQYDIAPGETTTGAPAQLRAWDRDGNYLALAKNKPNGDGSWPRMRIYSYDSSEVFISAIDSSCRETGTVKIQNVNWVASMNRKQASKPTANPHEYKTTRFFDARLGQAQRFLTEPEVYNPTDGLLTINTPTVFTATDYDWEIQSEQEVPMYSAAYNRARGKVQRMHDQNIYERNGENWDLLGPWPGGGHYYSYSEYYSPFPPYAYDIANERGVLFGGGYEAVGDDCMSVIYYVLNDLTYEMDKTGTWALKEPVNKPAARMCHTMAYDPVHGKTVLFGGKWMSALSSDPFPACLPAEIDLNDTWEWDGVNWTQRAGATCTGGDCYLCESDSCPANSGSCRSAAMAYDGAREKILLVSADTLWGWNGDSWAILNSTPFATYRPTIAYDSLSGQVVLYDSTKTAAWDGAAWATMSPALVPNVGYPTSVYDEDSQETLLGGGPRSGSYSTIWRWRGTGHDLPAQIFTVSVDHSKISEYTGVTFRSVTANFDTGGIGDVAGAAIDGATLLFWHDDEWYDIATNAAGTAETIPLQKSIANEETDLQTLLDANANSISFAVTPTAPRGFSTVTGEVVTDYAEVIVRYTINE